MVKGSGCGERKWVSAFRYVGRVVVSRVSGAVESYAASVRNAPYCIRCGTTSEITGFQPDGIQYVQAGLLHVLVTAILSGIKL